MTLVALGIVVAVAVITVVACWLALRREEEQEAAASEREEGSRSLATLQPIIDLERCMGSTACVDACPEALLKVVKGVTLIEDPASCVGHGRCREACPVKAIHLVFGTAERGVDLPLLRAGYETNRDGLFVAGELGGMGLIRNAFRQGVSAVESVPRALARPGVARREAAGLVDVVIVGAGPAGIAAAARCVELGLTFALLEQYDLGGSVAHYPRAKVVLTEPVRLPIVGRFGRMEMSKEELMAELRRLIAAARIDVKPRRRVTGVEGAVGDFRVTCEVGAEREVHRGRAIILAIGRRGTPRPLGVPGEQHPHVVHRLLDPELYRGRRALCVGGGDSAVEAAVALAAVDGCEVHLSYRGDAFARVKRRNRDALEAAVAAGRLTTHLGTQVKEITPASVTLADGQGAERVLGIDDVIVNVGGLLPTTFLESLGVQVRTSFGDAA